MIRKFAAGLLLAAVLGTALSGCGPESRAQDPGGDRLTTGTLSGGADIPPTATPGQSGIDPAGLDAELAAMERELDSMEMPSDGDFADAEGALY